MSSSWLRGTFVLALTADAVSLELFDEAAEDMTCRLDLTSLGETLVLAPATGSCFKTQTLMMGRVKDDCSAFTVEAKGAAQWAGRNF